jgi:L-lactate dehydrogenase
MKIGIIGTGTVGCACAMAAVNRGSARDIVLVNRTRKTAEAVATDLRYGTPLGPKIDIADGDYDALEGAGVVMITSGVNEKTGGATDRNDPLGRLRLLGKNAAIYRDIVPKIVRAAPDAVLLVVTDPPDPLADIAREAAKSAGVDAAVISAGTFIDTTSDAISASMPRMSKPMSSATTARRRCFFGRPPASAACRLPRS